MASDTDLEERLRGALADHAAADGLPEHVLLDAMALGRRSLRRRRRLAMSGAAACLAVVAGLAVAVVHHDDAQPQPTPPAPSPSPSVDETPDTTTLGTWAASLPQGAAPEVPYLDGTVVVEPDGTRVPLDGTSAQIVGQTVGGLVVRADAHYVVVRPDGQVVTLLVSTDAADGAKEAVVSPDGTSFTGGGAILDMRDLSVAGRVPGEAEILVAWTPVGIVYYAEDGHYRLWREGEDPITLGSDPGVFATGSDLAVDQCGTITRLGADGTLTQVSPHCVLGSWSMSPSGRWVVTPALTLVDVATGQTRVLADREVSPAHRYQRVWWNGDDSVLFPTGDWLVRCDLTRFSCERAAGPEKGLALP